MKILVIGGSSWDTLIHVDEIGSIQDDMSLWANNVVETVGGTGAGKALCLDALNYDVTLLTELAKDHNGKNIIDFFKKTSVKIEKIDSDKSTTHTNIMHSKGKRISVFTNVPTKRQDIYKSIDHLINGSEAVFLNISGFCREYIQVLRKHNKPVIVDIHDYNPPNPYHQDFIDVADIITASGVYIDNHIDFLEQMINQGKEVAVITKGSEGLIAMDKDRKIYKLPGYNEFDYVDSNGAGDSFCSAFAVKYLETGNVGESLKYGTICGGVACTSYELYNTDYTMEKIEKIKKRVDF